MYNKNIVESKWLAFVPNSVDNLGVSENGLTRVKVRTSTGLNITPNRGCWTREYKHGSQQLFILPSA